MIPTLQILEGDWLEQAKVIPDGSVHCCVTSPPYWGLRDYGVAGQIGLEKTPEEYVAKMVRVFAEVKRVLRDDGTLWLNLGDSYASNWACKRRNIIGEGSPDETCERGRMAEGLKEKDLCGIPWRVAFALQADGWWLRSDIIWCLSGGTWLYVKTEASDECLMMVKDLYRLKPAWVKLWTGQGWSGLLGISKSPRSGEELEIVLRSGERIACTPTHRFPTDRGILEASQIKIGDKLIRCKLPETYPTRDCVIDRDAAWFAGLYLAEGSRSGGNKIQIAGHAKEERRWRKIKLITEKFGGTAHRDINGNCMNIRVYGKVLNAILDELVSGKTAHDKGFSSAVWRYSNAFLEAMLRGYVEGDGCFDEKNNRWRLGFCRNYNLERDLRTVCARLGFHIVLKLSRVKYKGRYVPTFRGEIRETRSGHRNEKDTAEVVEIRKARCREVYDIGVACEPHLFALASGILTHNSKPNPMPESVTDRPTKSHEYLFLLAKSQTYFYDAEAIKEPCLQSSMVRAEAGVQFGGTKQCPDTRLQSGKLWIPKTEGANSRMNKSHDPAHEREFNGKLRREDDQASGRRMLLNMKAARDESGEHDAPFGAARNKRDVWTIATAPYSEAHFATFPPDLVKPCILAGTSARGCCPKCGAPWERIVEINRIEREVGGRSPKHASIMDSAARSCFTTNLLPNVETLGWQPTCECGGFYLPPHGDGFFSR